MQLRQALIGLSITLLLSGGTAFAEKENKGHGAGGVRADHASETGLEKGEAWAGSKESTKKGPKEEKAEKVNKEMKQKREKKEKKEMKGKER